MGYTANIFLLMPKTIWDVDALAYITAAGITNSTEKSAANYLFTQLKIQGIYSKLKAIYPVLGGTAFSHKFNGKNPLDTNAAYRLTFVGGVTHGSNGFICNGSSGYARTYFTSSIDFSGQNNFGLGGCFHSVTGTGIYSGATSSVGGYVTMQTGPSIIRCHVNCSSAQYDDISMTTQDGFKYISRGNGSNVLILNEGVVSNPAQNSIAHSARELYIGCRNFNGTAANFLNGTCQSFYTGDYLNSTELLALNTIDANFQTILGR
jgi:hypothetical protein